MSRVLFYSLLLSLVVSSTPSWSMIVTPPQELPLGFNEDAEIQQEIVPNPSEFEFDSLFKDSFQLIQEMVKSDPHDFKVKVYDHIANTSIEVESEVLLNPDLIRDENFDWSVLVLYRIGIEF